MVTIRTKNVSLHSHDTDPISGSDVEQSVKHKVKVNAYSFYRLMLTIFVLVWTTYSVNLYRTAQGTLK